MDLSKEINDAILDSEIDLECPTCNKTFSVKLSQVGSTVKCPYCGEIITLKDNF